MKLNKAGLLGLSVLISALLLAPLAWATPPVAAETFYALTFLRKVGTHAGDVLVLPEGVAVSDGAVVNLYNADGSSFAGSLALHCTIRGLGVVGSHLLASTCDGVSVVDISNRASPRLVRAIALDPDICPLSDDTTVSGLAADGPYAYLGLWSSGCVLNWQTGATLSGIGEWITRLQVYRGHLFSLELGSTYDEEVAVHGGLPNLAWEDDIEVQYVTNDFAVAADKVFSSASSPQNEGLCAAVWNPNPTASGARIDCLYNDLHGAFGVAASADSQRGDNVFTVRHGRLRWVKSAGTADLTEVASAPYPTAAEGEGVPDDLGTDGSQYVYAAGEDGLWVFRFEYRETPPPDPNFSARVFVPLMVVTP